MPEPLIVKFNGQSFTLVPFSKSSFSSHQSSSYSRSYSSSRGSHEVVHNPPPVINSVVESGYQILDQNFNELVGVSMPVPVRHYIETKEITDVLEVIAMQQNQVIFLMPLSSPGHEGADHLTSGGK